MVTGWKNGIHSKQEKWENEHQWIWWMADTGSMQGKGRNEGTGIWTVTH
jgi:hypothetical protein